MIQDIDIESGLQILDDIKLYQWGSMIATGEWWKENLPTILESQRRMENKLIWGI